MADPAAWIQYGALGLLAVVLYFGGSAALKLLDRFAGSIDKLEVTIERMFTHVQSTAATEAAGVERRHAEVLAAIQHGTNETRRNIQEAIGNKNEGTHATTNKERH